MILLWQLVITSEMVGLEANIAVEIILMIANIQTLGVPIRYSSVPGLVAAAAGVFLIPFLGFVLDRWAKSKQSKAKILAFTTMIELTGSLLVLLANGLKLALTSVDSDITNISKSINFNDLNLDQFVPTAANTSLKSIETSGNELVNQLEEFNLEFYNQPIPIRFKEVIPNYSPNDSTTQMSSTFLRPSKAEHHGVHEVIPFYAYIGMVGYTLLDCGYDSSACFLKTFVLHCTPVEHHVSVIVKSIMISSVGGVLVSILGSINLGQQLTAGTALDSSSALACLLTALSNLLLVCGTVATFTCGFCWKPPSSRNDDERRLLVSSTSHNLSFKKNDQVSSQSTPKKRTNQSYILASTSNTIDRDQVVDAVKLDGPYQSGVQGFLRRQKKQILVNVSAFFMCSSLYSFEVFAVNFAGTSVFHGDPAANVDSDEYNRYLRGVAVGSQGTVIYYITFAVSSLFHERSLAFFGWKTESLFTTFVYGVISVVSAISANLWVFYVVAVWTGMFRAVAISVPYILANQISAEQNGGKSSGTAIALVASMLPCGFVVCSAIMGPLIDFTGTASVNMFYSGACAFLGCVSIALLKV